MKARNYSKGAVTVVCLEIFLRQNDGQSTVIGYKFQSKVSLNFLTLRDRAPYQIEGF